MNCPSCDQVEMTVTELDQGLKASVCGRCRGHWIASDDYQSWLARHGEPLPERDDGGATTTKATEDQQARLCPACQVIMLKWQVGHGLAFKIDRCGSCGGIWLEEDEWDALKAKNLHDEIHRVFSSAWQSDERRAQMRAKLEAVYRKRFAGDYERVESFREWLGDQENRAQILAYIQESDPCNLQSRPTERDEIEREA